MASRAGQGCTSNKGSDSISPSSLKAYRGRAKRAIEEFIKWREDPVGYRPRNFTNSQQNANSTNLSKPKKKSTASRHKTQSSTLQGTLSTEAVSDSNELKLSYPLRSDFLAQILIPRDLSQLEAKRLGAFIITLSSDYQPE